MFTRYRTRGLILDKRDRGEADQLFTVFTEDFGMLELVGKAIRKISSKLRAGMEVFYLSEVEFIEGRAYRTLTDAIVQKKYFSSVSALQNLALVWRVAEIARKLTPPQEEDRMLFLFLKRVFEDLSYPLPREKQPLLLFFFVWNLAALLGYKPELFSCMRCGRTVEAHIGGFVPEGGGVCCSTCFSSALKQDRIPMGLDTARLLRFFLSHPWSEAKRLRMETKLMQELRGVSLGYLRFLIGLSRTRVRGE